VYHFFVESGGLYTPKNKGFSGGSHLGSHDLEIRSQCNVKNFFGKGLIVALNNQEVFWAQNYPENCSKISPKTIKNAKKCFSVPGG
jgi:hypothetical protein